MKTKFCLLFGLSLITNLVLGQTNLQQFFQLASKNDTIGELKLLEMWQASSKDDPDLFIAWFNYYFQKSMREVIRVNTDTIKPNGFKVTDPVTQKRVGSLYGDIFYDPLTIAKGFEYIDKGIEIYPMRLDMRFGKVYAYGKTEDYKNFTREIIKTIDYSNLIKNKWVWKEGKPLDNPEDFFLSIQHGYQIQLYNTNNDSLLSDMARIATAVLKHYPQNIENINDLSLVYLIQKDYQNAIENLHKAEKLAPNDCIVLGNLAQAYKLSGDKENALKYLELILKVGNQQEKAEAKKRLREFDK
jgi:tetratricopeptide (TPR) repeat protein